MQFVFVCKTPFSVHLPKILSLMAKKDSKPVQLESDELIEDVQIDVPKIREEGTILDKLKKNQKLLTGALVVVVLVIAGVWYMRYSEKQSNTEALDKAEVAFRNFYRDSLNVAIKGTASTPGLQRIAQDYEGTKAGNVANYMLGSAYLQQGKLDEGRKYLEAYDKDADLMVNVTALRGLAFAAEEKGKYAEAAELYEQAANKLPNRYTTPMLLMDAARCYELAKQNDAAVNLYNTILKDYPQSLQATEAKKYLALMGK